ncbi:MAG: TolC family protein [Mariprofundaceae bacterium]|nr:TolC family protein [Mariprofundaceae bacterium]
MRGAVVGALAVLLGSAAPLFAAEQVSFGDILHRIEQASPQLAASRAQADAAAAGIAVARSKYWGHAELFGRDTHYNNARLVNPISPPINFATFATDSNQYGYGAMLTLPVDIDGRITAAVRAQQHRSKAAVFQVANTRLGLFAQSASIYRALQKLSGVRQALSSQHQALIKHHSITEAAIRVGRIARVELLRIDAEIKAVEGQIAALNGDEARLRANLATLLNRPAFSAAVTTLKHKPAGLPQVGSDPLSARPDVQGAHSLTLAQEENLNSARREWLPSLSVQAVTSRNQGYTAAGDNTWSITGQLTWQFWDGGRRFSHADQVRANREAARQQQLSIQNRARAELDTAKSAWQASALQYEAAQAGLLAAREAEKIQSDRYRSGRLSAVDLLDAEAALAQARSSLSAAMADWWLADDQLHLATGHEPAAYAADPSHQPSEHGSAS